AHGFFVAAERKGIAPERRAIERDGTRDRQQKQNQDRVRNGQARHEIADQRVLRERVVVFGVGEIDRIVQRDDEREAVEQQQHVEFRDEERYFHLCSEGV